MAVDGPAVGAKQGPAAAALLPPRQPAPGAPDPSGRRRGRTLCLSDAWVTGWASVAGPAEGRGPLGKGFDEVVADHLLGEPSWERAETALHRRAFRRLCQGLARTGSDFDLLLAGDLLNQTVATSFAARDTDVPFCGLYNACATLAEALGLAALLCDGGYCRRVAVVVTSHHDAAERQYRFPTELGSQRPPTAQWTATGAAAFAVEAGAGDRASARLTAFTPGRVLDYAVRDPFNMGAAMAPAAADTLSAHLADLGLAPGAYGAIYTGDLARVGVPICEELLRARGLDLHLRDCGQELYDPSHQDVHAGGSGAACSGLVCAARILPDLKAGAYSRACLCATGALHSPTTCQQGESIPGIAHAVTLEACARP
jgi:stage V sporulation protein AD